MSHQFDPEIHHRRSIRMRGFDYSAPGVYFVTCVVRRRLCLFGEVTEGEMLRNAAGEMIVAQWLDLANRFPWCQPADFVVMPNHFHGLMIFSPTDDFESAKPVGEAKIPRGTLENSLGRVMQAFKSCATDAYIQGVHEEEWPTFERKLWLRNYWDRIVRDEAEWRRAMNYINSNPQRWLEDKHHPQTNAHLRLQRVTGTRNGNA